MRRLLLAFSFVFSIFIHAAEIHTIGGIGAPAYSGDGGPALAAALRNPYGLCIGRDAALYICDMDNHVIRRIKDGETATVAGTGKRGYSGDGGPALRAELNEPYEVRFDAAGNMYFVEMRNNIVRRVDARDQKVSTVAGNGTSGFSGDGGAATQGQLNQPHSIQLDQRGNLYICDIGNHRIRKMDLRTGVITTFAGTGEKKAPRDGGRFADEPLFGPRAIDFDSDGNLWLALREGNAIYKLDLQKGTIHHVAGTGAQGFRNGLAKEATLSGPKGISVGQDQNIYFADTESHSIRRVNLQNGQVESIAGTGERGDGPDGDPLKCKFARPHGIFASRSGLIYIGDSENNRVRVISPARP
jgi:streptogramin lyase